VCGIVGLWCRITKLGKPPFSHNFLINIPPSHLEHTLTGTIETNLIQFSMCSKRFRFQIRKWYCWGCKKPEFYKCMCIQYPNLSKRTNKQTIHGNCIQNKLLYKQNVLNDGIHSPATACHYIYCFFRMQKIYISKSSDFLRQMFHMAFLLSPCAIWESIGFMQELGWVVSTRLTGASGFLYCCFWCSRSSLPLCSYKTWQKRTLFRHKNRFYFHSMQQKSIL
jgi:hypothetical protein